MFPFDSLLSTDQLKGHAVVISGCDTGFGHGASLALAKLGFNVFAGCYTTEGLASLERAAVDVKTEIGCLTALPLDVTSDGSVAAFLEHIERETGSSGVYALINNAGIADIGQIEMLPMAQHKAIMEVNYFGVLRMLRAFTPLLRRYTTVQSHTIKPRLISIASISARIPFPMFAAYSASKHACSALTLAARSELSPFGIDVTTIEPFFARTPIVTQDRSGVLMTQFLAASEELKAAYGEPDVEEFKRESRKNVVDSYFTMDTEFVVDRIVKCVRTRNLSNRYAVGFMCYVLLFVHMFLPSWILENALADKTRKQPLKSRNL
ncbi:hypothetical protein BJ741DRAFT_588713 [Chytriomyces cf. hyalinus JEL632]|nr:hypothetical protein BJ741DRAFT_588713 [Chytriomyces cf. hyalinus JEL632]